MLMLALLWLGVVGYKDDIDNAKELFKSTFVDESTHSFQPPEPDVMPTVSPDDDDDIDV
jgi:hypothetical protein